MREVILRFKLLGGAAAIALMAALAPIAPAPVATAVPVTTVVAAPDTAPVKVQADTLAVKKYKNCTALNKKYRHGVGKKGAKDKVRGKTKPVTTFKRDDALYQRNKHLDRDKDKVACEKR